MQSGRSKNLASRLGFYGALLIVLLGLEMACFASLLVYFAFHGNVAVSAWSLIGSGATAASIYILRAQRFLAWANLSRTLFVLLMSMAGIFFLGLVAVLAISSFLKGGPGESLPLALVSWGCVMAIGALFLILARGLLKKNQQAEEGASLLLVFGIPYLAILLLCTAMAKHAIAGIMITGTLLIILCLSLHGFTQALGTEPSDQ